MVLVHALRKAARLIHYFLIVSCDSKAAMFSMLGGDGRHVGGS